MTSSPPVYKDLWFKLIGCLAISEITDSIGREESLFQRMSTRHFYTDLLGGFVIALILWEIVRQVIRWLDRRYDWMEQPLKRIFLQLLLGVILPSFLAFLGTMVFMKLAYNQDIFKTSWLTNEVYTVILLIVLINLVYLTWWLYLKWKEHDKLATNAGSKPINTDAGYQVVEVARAGKKILLPHKDIAYAYLNNGYCYIKPFEGDGFVTSYTLDELTKILDEDNFFRVNRQTLISRKSCAAYESIENGKIRLDTNPAFKSPVIVSQKRASEFRKWVS